MPTPRTSLGDVSGLLAPVDAAWAALMARYPAHGGSPTTTQVAHTVVEGAHLFHPERVRDYGAQGLDALHQHAPSSALLADALDLPHDDAMDALFERVDAKLRSEPVEDYRVDFEDGYGARPDDEEDATAAAVGLALARARDAGALPRRVGVRVKALTPATMRRAARTLDIVVTALGDALPDGFIITLPKVILPEQTRAFADVCDALEAARGLPRGALQAEIMIEQTQSVVDATGRNPIPALVDAGRGRVVGALIGTYDFTASAGVTAAHQALDHPLTDLARGAMITALSGTGLSLSDGSNAALPVGDREAVLASWRRSMVTIEHHLRRGLYQGWDLHPAQLPARWAATFRFFRAAHASTVTRLRAYLDRFAAAPEQGAFLDDAATGQAMLTHLLRARGSGAITAAELADAGLTPDELALGSFPAILQRRRADLLR